MVKDGVAREILPEHIDKALAAGYSHVGDTVTVVNEITGLPAAVSVDDAGETFSTRDETGAELRARQDETRIQRLHGDVGGQVLTGLKGAANSITLGGFDYAGGLLGGDEFRTQRKEEKRANPGADLTGEVAGYLLPTTGLAKGAGLGAKVLRSSPAALAERLGARVAATGSGKGLGQAALAKGAGFGIEGVAIGAGETLSDYSLATTDLEREQAASRLTANMLFAGGTGGLLGAGSEVAFRGIKSAKKLADGMSEKLAKRAEGAAEVGEDIASLDKAGLRAARDAEQSRLGTQLRDSANDYHAKFKEVDPILVATGESEKVLIRQRDKIRQAVGNQKGLAEKPGNIKDALQRQEQALAEIAGNKEAILRKLADEDLEVLETLGKKANIAPGLSDEARKLNRKVRNSKKSIRSLEKSLDGLEAGSKEAKKIARKQAKKLDALADLEEDLAIALKNEGSTGIAVKGQAAKRYGQFVGKNVTGDMMKEGVEVTAKEFDAFKVALETGGITGARRKALEGIDDLLAMNRAQIEATDGLLKGTSPKLAELKIAEDALSTGGAKKGFAETTATNALYGATAGALSTFMPFPVAAMAASKVSEKISDLVLGRLGKAVSKTAKGTSDVAARFVDVGAKVLDRAPPIATKVLAATRFSEKTPKLAASLPKATLIREFKAREAEIYSQVTRGPNGVTMRPSARKALAARLSGVRAASPELADSIETIANRKISFLASKLPKKPDFLAYQAGPDVWHPGNEAIRGFARYVAAVEDPGGVEDRLADGTITPQDVEAYKAVYPERYAEVRNAIVQGLPSLKAPLPIAKRMALSIFTDLPIEPSMNPQIFDRLQAQFTDEPGTEGGMQAPGAQPNFSAMGSIKSADKQTRAQKRAE